MAGFLFKKQKQEGSKGPPVISTPSTLQSVSAAPPLYARFASTAQANNNVQSTPKIVSSPMSLASPTRNQRGTAGNGVGGPGKYGQSANSLATNRGKLQEDSIPIMRPRVGEQAIPRPLSREILDKPLPPPAPPKDDDLPVRRVATSRAAPTSFQVQAPRGRTSLDSQIRDNKPLPRPGPAQEFNPGPNYSFTPAPPRSKPSTSPTSQPGPPSPKASRKIQPSPASFSEKALPTPVEESLPPPITRTQDLPLHRNGTVTADPASAATVPEQITAQDTPLSDRGLDLPPDAVLFQEYGETITEPSQPESLPLPEKTSETTKPTEQVPSSSSWQAAEHSEVRDSPPVLSTSPVKAPLSPRRPLPSPPPNAMGNTASSPSAVQTVLPASLPSPSYKDLYPSHVLSNMNGGFNDVTDRQQQHVLRNQSISRTTSPPLPSGAALPQNFHNFLASTDQIPPSTTLQPQQPSSQWRNQRSPNPGRSQTLMTEQPPPQVALRKSPSVQVPSTQITRGKPRIFAAMEAQEIEISPPAPIPTTTPLSPPQVAQALPPPAAHHHLMKPHPNFASSQQSIPRIPPPAVEESSISKSPPLHSHHLMKHHPNASNSQQSLPHVPPVEEFSTPRSDFEPLPEFSGSGFEVDPRLLSSAAKSPPPPAAALLPSEAAPGLEHQTRKRSNSRSASRQEDQQKPILSPQSPPRARKLSKARDAANTLYGLHRNGSATTLPGTPDGGHLKVNGKTSKSRSTTPNPEALPTEPILQVDGETLRNAGIPLDDDPFARVEGVKMLKPTSPKSRGGKSPKEGALSIEAVQDGMNGESAGEGSQFATEQKDNGFTTPLTPVSPEIYRQTRKEKKSKDQLHQAFVIPYFPPREPAEPLTLAKLLSDGQVLGCLLDFMSFYEWCILLALSKVIRSSIVKGPNLRQTALERFLKTVGYARWAWEEKEPLALSLQDLNDYMRGVSTPTHEYARVAAMFIHSLRIHPNQRDPSLGETVQRLVSSTRAYNRVLLRLRAQAEKEASLQTHANPQSSSTTNGRSGNFSPSSRGGTTPSRASSRAPSPTASNNSNPNSQSNGSLGAMQMTNSPSQTNLTFRSPLFRLKRAPLLRVFVPSPDGDWLSDKSVLECEAECKRAGIQHLMRMGDVVWDVAVGDEGNAGRLVWDGSYLIDLDYTYSAIGDLPKYLQTLAFPPSYFHRVVRTGQNKNPIIHIDISPWGEEIALNLQLLQDRVRTETPQGAYHNVMRWVHRSSFQIRAPRGQRFNHTNRAQSNRIPIADSDNLFVDPGWYGTIVVETEGTNEALADLQDRCGPGAFPPRARGVNGNPTPAQVENRKVFRVLREKSRPGEIWIHAVGLKERLL